MDHGIGTASLSEDGGSGDQLFDAETETVSAEGKDEHMTFEGAVELEGGWYVLNRRQLKPKVLRSERESAGFSAPARK